MRSRWLSKPTYEGTYAGEWTLAGDNPPFGERGNLLLERLHYIRNLTRELRTSRR